jgi:hypothetical protein
MCRVAQGLHCFALANEIVIICINILYLLSMRARVHAQAFQVQSSVTLTVISIILTFVSFACNMLGMQRLHRMAASTWIRVQPVVNTLQLAEVTTTLNTLKRAPLRASSLRDCIVL